MLNDWLPDVEKPAQANALEVIGMAKTWNRPKSSCLDRAEKVVAELDKGRGTAAEVREALDKVMDMLREES